MPSFSAEQLAQHVNGTVVGHCQETITSVAALNSAHSGQISYMVSRAHLKTLSSTRASLVMISKEFASDCPVPALVVEHTEMAFAQIASLFARPATQIPLGISEHAQDASSATIDPTARIGARCVVGEDVVIGANTVIMPGVVIGNRCQIGMDGMINSQVTLYHDVQLGDRVLVHSGAVLGADGFGHVLVQN